MGAVQILPQPGETKRSPRPAVYVLQCADGSLYTGATTDLTRRMAAHVRGAAAKCTRGRLPVVLLAWWYPDGYREALSQEARFKRLRRAAKWTILAGDEAFGCKLHKAARAHV